MERTWDSPTLTVSLLREYKTLAHLKSDADHLPTLGSGVMLITTTIIAIAVVKLKHLPMLVAIVFFLASGFIDGLFFGSSAKKVPHGESEGFS